MSHSAASQKLNELMQYSALLAEELDETSAGLVALTLELENAKERYSNIFENSIEGIYQVDMQGRLILANPAFINILGYNSVEELQESIACISKIYVADDQYQQLSSRLLREKRVLDFSSKSYRKDGSIVWLRENIRPIHDESGQPLGYESLAIDFTKGHEIQERLKLISKVFEHSVEGIIITDAETNIIEVNKAFTQTTGYSAEEAIGKNTRMLNSGWHDDKFYKSLWITLTNTGLWQGEITDRRKNGELYEQWLTICAINNDDNVVVNYIAIFNDITEKKSSEQRIHQLAYYDTLTKLPNRSLVNDRLSHAIEKANRDQHQIAVLFIDLDNFKNINDVYGHQSGDKYLQIVATTLTRCVRKEDTVARWGGDEFIITLEKVCDIQDIETIAKELITMLSQPVIQDGHELYGGASIGISIYPDDGSDAETLIKNADTAMYDAKDVGKNDYRFYSEELNVKAFQRLRMENELRQALEKNEFVLFYQPTVALDEITVTGAEALIRWQHSELGLISPQRFIPHAEKSVLIEYIGEWVIKTACEQMVAWDKLGIMPPRISINVSSKQLKQQRLVSYIKDILDETGIAPELLELELTESAIMKNPEEAVAILTELKELGLSIAIDDFGTGYSSLSYLKRLPVDKIKIDQSFVRDISNEPGDHKILNAIIALSHSMGLKVIAEGVESKEEALYLHACGCKEVQGYHFYRPMSAQQFTDLFA